MTGHHSIVPHKECALIPHHVEQQYEMCPQYMYDSTIDKITCYTKHIMYSTNIKM